MAVQPPAVLAAVTPPEPVRSRSRSIGRPDRGRLRDPARLASGPDVVERGGHPFGTEELVSLLQRTAAQVRRDYPGPRLAVGDLSARGGGRVRPHRSHRSGRDADVGFFMHTEAGEPVDNPAFIDLDDGGCGAHDGQRYCWDHARNWAFIAALASDALAQVQYIFIAPDLRERILGEGLRQGAPEDLMHRVEVLTAPRTGSNAHRSHFHVRIYCPDDDRPGCVDEAPIHEWVVRRPPPRPLPRARPAARARRRDRA